MPPAASPAVTHHTATLLVQCADRTGVVAAIGQLLFGLGANIIECDQFTDQSACRYFQRVRLDYSDILVGAGNVRPMLEQAMRELVRRYPDMEWRVAYDSDRRRVGVLVSKMDHCLYDLLLRVRSGELPADIPVVISNHDDLRPVASMFGVDFHFVDAHKLGAEETERRIEELLFDKYAVDTVALARYMQILSARYCERHAHRTINIHHSFLPAFEGGRPYHRAHERGVKLIGATAHYVTVELDSGPIIEQQVARITHRDSVENMIRKGRDLERLTLARAVRWHVEDRVLVHGNKTVVFDD